MKMNQKKPQKVRLQTRTGSRKTPQGLPDKQVLTQGCQCSLEDLTEEEQKAFDQVIESLAGPTEEEFNRKFQELAMTATDAANAGKDEEAQQTATTMLMMAGANAIKNPSPDTKLRNKASACEDNGDWAGAERARRKLLALRKQEGCAGVIAMEQFDLSRLLRLLGRLDEAWRYARAATKTARKADLAPLTVMTLENEAQCALERKDVARALAATEEAMKLVEPERVQNLIRMRILTMRAQCLLETGDGVGPERDLKSASRLDSDMIFTGMGGAIAARARLREIEAELQIRRKNLTGAVKNLKRAMALRRQSSNGCCGESPYALVLRARGLERFAEVSKRLGNVTEGSKALSEAMALRESAHLPLISGKTRRGKASQAPRRRRRGATASGAGNLKVLLLIAALAAGLLAAMGFWRLRVHRSHEQLCVNQMRNLYAAAVSYCLEHKLGPDHVVSVGELAWYVKPSFTNCPDGGAYPSISVFEGPSCPNGHLFEPGVARPLRATHQKTAGLYREFGLTKLIDAEAESTGAASSGQPYRPETN